MQNVESLWLNVGIAGIVKLVSAFVLRSLRCFPSCLRLFAATLLLLGVGATRREGRPPLCFCQAAVQDGSFTETFPGHRSCLLVAKLSLFHIERCGTFGYDLTKPNNFFLPFTRIKVRLTEFKRSP